jgi:hypothetical protein
METYLHCTEHHVVVHTKTQGRVIYVRQIGSADIDCMQLAHVEISDRFFLSAVMKSRVSGETELVAECQLIRGDSVMRKLLSSMHGMDEASNWDKKGMQIRIMTFFSQSYRAC